MIKTPTKFIALLSGAAFLMSSAFAQGVTTDPVGYVSTTTPTGDDALIGLPLTQAIVFAGVADSVSGAQVSVSATLTLDAYNNTHYVLVTSGANAGQWSEVIATAVDSITTAEVLLAATDTFDVVPFWTLATAFPGGAGVGASANPNVPSTTILLNDLNASGVNLSAGSVYFYFAGPSPAAGFYQTGPFADGNNVRLSPETYVTIRNNSGSDLSTVVTGFVPADVVGTTVIGVLSAGQDNQVVNPYPAAMTLATSGLTDVVAPAANPNVPTDTVLIFDPENTSGQNLSAGSVYFYFAGPSPSAGWYQTGSFADGNNVEIPAGGAFIIRKGAGDDEVIAWNPPVPYSL